MKQHALRALLLSLITFGTTFSTNALSGALHADLGIGHLDGYLQTPKGGNFNTTTLNRPSFSDVGIHEDAFYEIGFGVEQAHYFAAFNYLHLDPNGIQDLSEPLLTHTQYIPADQQFAMRMDVDWYMVQVGRTFENSKNSRMTPYLEFDWLKYQYAFWSYPKSSSRGFTMANLVFGLQVEHFFRDNFSIFGEAKGTLPTSTFQTYNVNLGTRYYYALSQKLTLVPNINVGLLYFDYEDNQPVPNHVRYNNFPYVKMGIEVRCQ